MERTISTFLGLSMCFANKKRILYANERLLYPVDGLEKIRCFIKEIKCWMNKMLRNQVQKTFFTFVIWREHIVSGKLLLSRRHLCYRVRL